VANGDQINIKPHFEAKTVPCEGEAGDLLVITPLREGQLDGSPQGLASLWFCTKSSNMPEQRPAVWKRVQFDFFATCEIPVLPKPPQDHPPLREG
jgi:hypothetical protein